MSQFNEYQTLATKVKTYSKEKAFMYLLIKLQEEGGEIAKELIRCLEDRKDFDRDRLTKEIGDLIWCCTALAECHDIKLQDVIDTNIEKLRQRNLL